MTDDALDGTLGRTGHEPPPFLHGSLADLTARANAAGFPTVSTWVDHLEDYAAGAYGAGEASAMTDLDIAFDGLLPDGVAAMPQELARYVRVLQGAVTAAVLRSLGVP